MKRLLVVDGKTLSYKAFEASKNSKVLTETGQNVPMLSHFMTQLLDFMGTYEPSALIVVIGQAENEKEIETQPSYRLQLALLKVFLESLNIQCVTTDKLTADAIKTVVQKSEAASYKTYVVTAERRVLQILSKQTHVVLLGKQRPVHYNPNKFYLEVGVESELYPDLYAFLGHENSVVEGITGIGEKTAVKILQEYGSLKTVYGNLNMVTDHKLKETFETYKDELIEWHEKLALHRIDTVDIDFDQMVFSGFNMSDKMVFEHFGLSSLLEQAHETTDQSLPLFEYMDK